ncbi:DUF2637 domain-containing protein [Nocardiopsis terrae]|uniref:DUF2637 domain-containing protein n=1 Tax=Streptomyces sp. NPDC057554 TaxID=3350538 RepID=UPI00369C47BF
MTDRIGGAVDAATATLNYLAGLPPATQIILAVTVVVALALLVGYGEYRRRTRTTPTLRARAGALTARGLRAAWTALRTPPNADQKTKRANTAENLLVFWFVFVVGGLIMQGLIPFARDDMGLTGVWPYLLFFSLDGMAAYFGLISYRLAKEGAKATSPRLMVFAIMGGSAWFQWAHAADRDLPARVAWTVLPLIAGYLWETVLKYRRRAWKKANTDTGRQVPKARWMWDPLGSLGITRRTHMWNLDTWEEGLETHMTRTECVRQLRREFGPFWSWKVPADVAIRLKRGFKVEEAAARVPEVIATHRREVENRRIVKEAERQARAGAVEPGTYTVSVPDTPMVDLSPVAGVADVVEPLEPAPAVVAPWVDPAAAWDPQPNEEDVPFPDEVFPEPAPFVPAPAEEATDPWADAPAHTEEFMPLDVPTAPAKKPVSFVTPELSQEEPKPPVLPLDERGRQITPKPGEPAFQDAVNLYLTREREGNPLSGRKLCELNGVNPDNRLWRQAVVRAAKEQQATATGRDTPALFNLDDQSTVG